MNRAEFFKKIIATSAAGLVASKMPIEPENEYIAGYVKVSKDKMMRIFHMRDLVPKYNHKSGFVKFQKANP